MGRRGRLRRRRILGFAARVLAILILADFGLYLLHLGVLRSRMSFDNQGLLLVSCVDEATLALTGKSQPSGKPSAVCNFPEAKPPGGYRIGCFGDSFTYSFEVEDGLDFPALLGRLFRDQGLGQVEVLNFGNDWFGFHQARMLFDRLGPRFGLDAAVFGPQSSYDDRDTTFCHSERDAPSFIHARYVLDGEGVRLVEPPGGIDYRRRFYHYNSFVPHGWALRYDRRPPAFLRALLPERLRERVANPFYYLSPAERRDEVPTLYARLLATMPAETRVVVGLYDGSFVERLVRNVPERVALETLTERGQFPYKSAGYHNSPTGNLLLATWYHNLLGLGEPLTPVLIETAELEPAGPVGAASTPLHAFEGVAVALDGQRVGGFVDMVPAFMAESISHEQQEAWQRGAIDPGLLQGLGASSLLALVPPESGLVDAAFLPLSGPLEDGDELGLRCDGQERALATVRLVTPHIGRVELPGGYRAFHARRAAWRWPDEALEGCARSEEAELTLAGEPLLRFERAGPSGHGPDDRGGLEALPIDGTLLLLRASGDVLLEPEPGEGGLVELVLHDQGGEPQRHPIARWRARPFDPEADEDVPPPGAIRPAARPR
jgi:hypothetical protein